MSRLAGARILIVEDNHDLAENLVEIMEDEGAFAFVARTAEEARRESQQGFDIALVDVQLPDSTGLELVPDLKKVENGLAEIIIISGHASVESAAEAVTRGAYAYIIKPFEVEDIIGHVKRAWRQVRSSRKERALATELKIREANLRALVETVQALLLVLDHEGRVIQANPAVAAVTGVPVAELIGKNWIDELVPEADVEQARQSIARLLAGEDHSSYEHRIFAKNGTSQERVVSWQSTRVRDKNGDILIYASGLDVTEVKALEHRNRLAKHLVAVGTLAAGLAHEIRNPLNSANLQLRLLDRRIAKRVGDDTDGTLRGPIALVQQEIERLSNLVQEFLQFARPRVLSIEENIDIAEIAEQVIEMERPSVEEHGVEVELDAPQPVEIAADPAKIRQVLLNLTRNSIEAVGYGGRVVVKVSRDGAGAQIVVRDNGPGLSEEVLVRIFEPFFSTKPEGTGLGMAICHSVITQHGGDIRVRSHNGAECEIRLPARPPSSVSRDGSMGTNDIQRSRE